LFKRQNEFGKLEGKNGDIRQRKRPRSVVENIDVGK